MNKTEKDYTVSRITDIRVQKQIKCACDKPDINDHMRTAAIKGELKLKQSNKITASAYTAAMGSGRYGGGSSLVFRDIFQEPASFKAEMAEYNKEQKKHADKNAKTDRFYSSLIDRVNLNKFEDGQDAIAEAIAYQP